MKDLPKDDNLDEEEKQILEDFEKGEFVSVENLDQAMKDSVKMAHNTLIALKKSKNINIRLTETDLEKLREKAAEVGIPYQTLVTSVLHRFANKPLNLDW